MKDAGFKAVRECHKIMSIWLFLAYQGPSYGLLSDFLASEVHKLVFLIGIQREMQLKFTIFCCLKAKC